jgi:hypothetical protein
VPRVGKIYHRRYLRWDFVTLYTRKHLADKPASSLPTHPHTVQPPPTPAQLPIVILAIVQLLYSVMSAMGKEAVVAVWDWSCC